MLTAGWLHFYPGQKRGAAALQGHQVARSSRQQYLCTAAGYLPLYHQDGRLPGQVLRGAPLGALLQGRHLGGSARAAEPAAEYGAGRRRHRASLDASELQDDRGSKRDALARTPPSATAPERPPPPAVARKKPATRGGAQLEAELACAAPPRPSRKRSLSPPRTMPPPPLPAPPTLTPAPPEALSPGHPPLPTPSAARRSVLALPAVPSGDPPAGARLALSAADTVPTLPHTHTFPASPPTPTPYTPSHTHGAASPRLFHPTAPPDLRQTYPAAPLPHLPPKSPPFDAHLHRAALPFHRRLSRPPRRPPFRPVSTSRSIRGDVPCPRHPSSLHISCGYTYSHTI